MDTKGFKKGDSVYHVNGGSGVLTGHFENDWSGENPPAVKASVRVTNTIFYDVRQLDIEDLRIDRRS